MTHDHYLSTCDALDILAEARKRSLDGPLTPWTILSNAIRRLDADLAAYLTGRKDREPW